MIPTTKLRWYVQRNSNITADMVVAERDRTNDPMMVCKKRLINETQPRLQQFFKFFEDEEIGCWEDVETVIEGY